MNRDGDFVSDRPLCRFQSIIEQPTIGGLQGMMDDSFCAFPFDANGG
jgi:hypothetical protein